MVLVDTNVLVDVLQNDPQWADWSIAQLRAQAKLHDPAINPVIYAEKVAGAARLLHRRARRCGGLGPLLTRDASRFRTYFPSLDVIVP